MKLAELRESVNIYASSIKSNDDMVGVFAGLSQAFSDKSVTSFCKAFDAKYSLKGMNALTPKLNDVNTAFARIHKFTKNVMNFKEATTIKTPVKTNGDFAKFMDDISKVMNDSKLSNAVNDFDKQYRHLISKNPLYKQYRTLKTAIKMLVANFDIAK